MHGRVAGPCQANGDVAPGFPVHGRGTAAGDRVQAALWARGIPGHGPESPPPVVSACLQGSSFRSFAASSSSSWKSGWAIWMRASARSRRFFPKRFATPNSVTT